MRHWGELGLSQERFSGHNLLLGVQKEDKLSQLFWKYAELNLFECQGAIYII